MRSVHVRRDLLDRLEGRAPDGVLLRELEEHFEQRGDPAGARWMQLERLGYGRDTSMHNLDEVLGDDLPAGIMEAIVRSRLRRGTFQVGQDGPVIEWPHFFVEPFDELRRWRTMIVHGGPITAEFLVPADSGEPRSLAFPSTVFIDVVNTIVLEIADAIRRGGG